MNTSNTNQERMPYMDHVRGLTVLFMIICHTVIVYSAANVLDTPLGIFGQYIIGTWPGAPVFMIIMGLFFAYSSNKPLSVKILRGFKLYLLGLVLNVLRYVVPYLIAMRFNPEAFSEIRLLVVQEDYSILWQLFYELDILTFAGIAFILLSIVDYFFKRDWQWVLLAIVVVFVAPHLWGTGREWGVSYLFFQPFWGDAYVEGASGDTSFPVFPWLVYPIVGILIGKCYVRGEGFEQILRKMVLSSLLLAVVGVAIMLASSSSQLGDFYRMYPGGTILCIAFDLAWIAMFMLLTRHNLFQNALNKLNFWSKNITLIYLVQWVLIGFGMIVFGYRQQESVWVVCTLIPVFFVLSYLCTVYLLNSPRFMKTLGWFTR